MKLAGFSEFGVEHRRIGVVDNGRLRPLASVGEGADLLDVILQPELLADARGECRDSLPIDEVKLLLPFACPGKVVCLGLNYAEHAKEGGHKVPDYPSLFLRVPTSLVPAGGQMIVPSVSSKFDFEAELMVVIGKTARHVPASEALQHVFGYTCFNDGSVRDYQRRTAQWTAGKNFDSTGGIGPWVVTADELPPGAVDLAIQCRLNGEVMQSANTSEMIVSVAEAIAIVSEIMTLLPGDMIAMGTPQGVGHARNPQVWMKAGDRVEIEIEGIGVLGNSVSAESGQRPVAPYLVS